MSLKRIFLKTRFTYKLYLYYNLYIRHKCFLKRKQYSQWGEDRFIIEYFKEFKNGVYLDIGCFHPFMYSNTCLLHKKGWVGTNVDINPTSIDLFNIARPNDINLCTTVDENQKEFKVYFDDPFSPVNTIDKNFYKSLKGSFFKDPKEFNIKSKSFQEIIILGGIKDKIDFINIDAEGNDLKILKQLNLTKYKVKLISIETHNVDGTKTKNCDSIEKYLNENNFFTYKRVGPTTLFFSKNSDSTN